MIRLERIIMCASAKKLDSPSIFDICPDFSSYISEVESNMDEETFENYLKNPVPTVIDVVGDFAENGYSYEEIVAAVKSHYGEV